ncbi:MAG TPA: cytochrome c biogenesis protein CcsA, partial [Opitutaceae bacterium]
MLSVLSDRQWLWCAAALYTAGLVLGTVALVRGQRASGALLYAAILAGYVLQWVGLGLRGHAEGGCPLGNRFEIFQFTAWSAVTLYLVVGVTFRSSVLGYFSNCLGAALTLLSLSMPGWDSVRRAHIFGGNPWIELHAALAIFSYGVFGLLALTSALFLLRHFSIKSKHLGGWFSFLPSILDLDHIEFRLLGTGVALLT